MYRYLTAALATTYWFTMIALIGGIGVMASGASAPAARQESGIGFALIMLLQG
jgi:hypothetical protein